MLKSKAILVLSLMVAAAVPGVAKNDDLCEGFLPKNDMKIPVGANHVGISRVGGITEAQFNMVMDRIQAVYTSKVAEKGGTLVVNRLWRDETVNASAQQQGRNWIINMYGGLARHGDTTYEGMALVACHEIGHHMGGAPKLSSFGGTWATNEGGSDYFATHRCLREFFAEDDNREAIQGREIDPQVRERCEAQFTTEADRNLCLRIALGGESVAYLFQSLRKEPTRPRFGTPDTSEVAQTNDRHPATQCRMDTYYAGMSCTVAITEPNSNTDFRAGSCVQGTHPIGFRPRCWFNPESGGGGGGGGGGDGQCPFQDPAVCQAACQISPNLPWCNQ